MAASEWKPGSRTYPDGVTERWLERQVPGRPGVREMRYLDGGSRMRDSVPVGTVRVVQPGEGRTRTSFAPLAGYRSTSTPLTTDEPKFTREDVIREARGSNVRVRIVEDAYSGFLRQQETQYGPQRIGDDVEIGGGVFGRYENERFTVAELSGRIIADYAERYSGRLDLDFIERHADHHRQKKTGQRLLGFWHSHSGVDSLDGENLFACPSGADLNSLESLHERSRNWIGNSSLKAPSLGLIITPRYLDDADEAGWNRPLVTAFLARGEDSYPAVTFARVQIDGRPEQSAWAPLASMDR